MQPAAAQTDLIVRQYERVECTLPARISIAAAHAPLVRVSRLAPSIGGAIPAHIVDISRGGMGLRTPVYIPTRSQLMLSVDAPQMGSAESVRLEIPVTLRRVTMVDRQPNYYFGVAFQPLSAEVEQKLESLVLAIRSRAAAPEGTAP
jgi:c-di-GMP-binding flagellar brake protein YcgR